MAYDATQFAEKYQLAVQADMQARPQGGLCGFELEWNLLDGQFRPLLTVGAGPGEQSFVDFLRAECLSPWLREFSQLEVFHWMIEWATRPYFLPRTAVYETRLMEGALLNALYKAGQQFGEQLYTWPGNLLLFTRVGITDIPGSWHLAKRRYLERCVSLYGDSLATAGTHTNLSLPDPLLAWDFMHLPAAERRGGASLPLHLDDFKSQFYIAASRRMRAFAALFIAASAATPFQAHPQAGRPTVVLSQYDSVRNLTFPNPESLDLPELYRSYDDYLRLSYDLVRRGVRFGNNNWTPVRARSFAEPVERLIAVTSEQLQDLYTRRLYSLGQANPAEEMGQQIEVQNLLARINLPMARVEIRTDDGGHPLEIDVANLTLKHLLMARIYADPDFARAFRYDREDISRARRNEETAARHGLRGEIEDPFTAKPVSMRAFLRWTLAELRPLAEALGLWEDLAPLVEMADGGPNTAERLRALLASRLGSDAPGLEVPLEILRGLAEDRKAAVIRDVEWIAETYSTLGPDAARLGEFLQHARDEAHSASQAPVRFRPRPEVLVEFNYPDKTSEILALAQSLIRIPSVTACPEERLGEVRRAATLLYDYARNRGLEVRYFDQDRYPALLIGLPGGSQAPVMLGGHFDVVAPDPDDSQFEPRVEGDYLWGRGAADMKTVVATDLVWLKDALHQGEPYPPVNLLLVGNEENGETEPAGTPHVLELLKAESSYQPGLYIAGERTGERGDERWGEICTQNRGVMRFTLRLTGARGHSGAGRGGPADLTMRLLKSQADLTRLLQENLTLANPDGWQSQARFPFIQVGEAGVFNVTPGEGLLGVEVRSIPEDDLEVLRQVLLAYCQKEGFDLQVSVMENGVACAPDNPYLHSLLRAVRQVSQEEPRLGRKLPGTSARFAPGGQGIVWGQSGVGPHARDERHYIPSILPYYQALAEFGRTLKA